MLSRSPTLDDLRREIDRIDDAMHDLLMQRTAVVEEVGRAKARTEQESGSNTRPQFFRPGREAQVLRRLVANHQGIFPKASLARIWREIMTGQLRVQTEIPVAVYTSENRRGYWDVARDQYGAAAIYQPCSRTHQVVAAVRKGTAAIGVLPLPQDDDSEPWWPLLAVNDPNSPRIVSKLPFAPANGTQPGALAIACLDPEPTGDDHAYLLVETDGEVSHTAVANGLSALGFEPRQVIADPRRHGDRVRLHLFETAGMVERDDPRLQAVVDRSGLRVTRVVCLGGYAVPLDHAAMNGAGTAGR